MRTTVSVALVLMGLAGVAAADPSGVYDVKFEEVSTNCTSPLRYPPGKLTIKVVGKSLTVDITNTPLMGGIPAQDKISAKSKPGGGTMVEGMTGIFSVAGKVSKEGLLHLVMVGEYSANGKPLCTQSWNVNGPRNTDAKPKKTRASLDLNPMQELLALVNVRGSRS